MAYSKDSIFKDKLIRLIVASMCYVEIALIANEWRTSKLEELIFNRKGSDQTGVFRRMLRGTVPSHSLMTQIENKFKGKLNILKWRNHPIANFISLKSIKQKSIDELLMSTEDSIWKCIWEKQKSTYPPQSKFSRIEFEYDQISCIANHKNLEAFTALIALSRELRDHGFHSLSYCASSEAKILFPKIISETPNLYICWKPLFHRLNDLFWKPTDQLPRSQDEPTDIDIEDEIERLVRSKLRDGYLFPPPEIISLHNRTYDSITTI